MGWLGNHNSTATLLTVPRYGDLLEGQDDQDESKHGQLFITMRVVWWTNMAKWIGDARAAEHEEESDVVAEPEVVSNTHATA